MTGIGLCILREGWVVTCYEHHCIYVESIYLFRQARNSYYYYSNLVAMEIGDSLPNHDASRLTFIRCINSNLINELILGFIDVNICMTDYNYIFY